MICSPGKDLDDFCAADTVTPPVSPPSRYELHGSSSEAFFVSRLAAAPCRGATPPSPVHYLGRTEYLFGWDKTLAVYALELAALRAGRVSPRDLSALSTGER